MCSDNKENVRDIITEKAGELLGPSANPAHVEQLVAVAIQSYTNHVIGRMISRLMEPSVISSMSAPDIVNCITKLIRLLPDKLVKPIVEDLTSKLGSVNLQELVVDPTSEPHDNEPPNE